METLILIVGFLVFAALAITIFFKDGKPEKDEKEDDDKLFELLFLLWLLHYFDE